MRDKLQITGILMPPLKVCIAASVTEHLIQSHRFQQGINQKNLHSNEAAANQDDLQVTST